MPVSSLNGQTYATESDRIRGERAWAAQRAGESGLSPQQDRMNAAMQPPSGGGKIGIGNFMRDQLRDAGMGPQPTPGQGGLGGGPGQELTIGAGGGPGQHQRINNPGYGMAPPPQFGPPGFGGGMPPFGGFPPAPQFGMPRFGGGFGSPMPMFGGNFAQPQFGNMPPQMPPQFGGGGFGGGMMMGPQMPQFGGGMPRQQQSPFGMPGMFGGMGPRQPMFGGMGFGGPQGMPQFGGGFQPPQFNMPQFGGGLLGFGGGGFGGGMPSNMGPQMPQAKVDAPPQAFDGGGGMMDMRYRGGPVMSPAQRRQREQDMLNMQNMAMRGFGG